MSSFEFILIALGLSMDAFAVSLGAGAHAQVRGPRPVFRLAFHFGLFQFLMTVIGWGLGYHLEKMILTIDHWVAFALLLVVGIRMIQEGLNKKSDTLPANPSKGWTLMSLSVATSLDALAIGLSFGMLRLSVWYPSVLIGAVTFALSFSGIKMGNFLGRRFGKNMEVFGGLLLILIGLKIVWEHLFA